jgi:RNA polymerase sigma-70 factor (ECF subfamily)
MNVEAARWQDVAARLRPFVARRVAPAEVDDVLQEVFVRAQRGIPGLEDEDSFTSWLFQIARTSVADHARMRARHPLAAEDPGDELASETEEDDREASRTLSACVSMFVAQLPSPYREAVTLVELQDLSMREAADIAGVSVSAMKSRVQRGRAQLRVLFDRCCEIAVDARGKVTGYARRVPPCDSCK